MQHSGILFPMGMDADDGHRPSSPPSSSSPPTVNLVSPVRPPNASTTFQLPVADDLDVMLLHEDLPELLRLAARLQEATMTSSTAASSTSGTTSAPIVVDRMQQALLSQPGEPIPRGRYPMVDAMLQDAMEQLEDAWQSLTTAPKVAHSTVASKPSHKRKPSDAPIAVKYAKAQTDVLMQWMIDHQDNPFPTTQDLDDLSRTTGLTKTQVNNWATNVRKRNLKATCENGKKPHHFIDFLFHRRDREAKATNEQQPCDMTTDTIRGAVGGGTVNMMYHHQHPLQQPHRQRQQSSSTLFRSHHVVDLTQEPTHRRTPSFMATNAVSPSWNIKAVFDEVDAEMFGPFPDRRGAQQQQQSVPAPLHMPQSSFQVTSSFDDEPYALEQQQRLCLGENATTSAALERLHSGSIQSLDDAELDKMVRELDEMNDIV